MQGISVSGVDVSWQLLSSCPCVFAISVVQGSSGETLIVSWLLGDASSFWPLDQNGGDMQPWNQEPGTNPLTSVPPALLMMYKSLMPCIWTFSAWYIYSIFWMDPWVIQSVTTDFVWVYVSILPSAPFLPLSLAYRKLQAGSFAWHRPMDWIDPPGNSFQPWWVLEYRRNYDRQHLRQIHICNQGKKAGAVCFPFVLGYISTLKCITDKPSNLTSLIPQMLNIELPNDAATPLLIIYPRELKI